jgi:glycosyltransferase domain-containing protein
MTLLHHLTLVVPTYKRSAYALRAMRYWSKHLVQMIVLDGSPQAISAVQLQGLASNIRYIHSPVSIQDRLSQACDLLTTPYAALLSDDDFFASSGLELALAELEAQSELQCCNGNCISFNWRAEQQLISTRLHYAEQILLHHDQPLASQRISAHFRHYTPASIYAVHRTQGFRLAMKAAAHPNSCIYSSEIAFEFVSALLGGMKTLNCCYWLRSMENEPVKTVGSDRGLRFHQWLVVPEYQHEVRSWFLYVGELMANQSQDVKAVMELLQLACEQYLSFVEEHFAATHRADRGQPGAWAETAVFIESKGVTVLAEFDSILQLVKSFHLNNGATRPQDEKGVVR